MPDRFFRNLLPLVALATLPGLLAPPAPAQAQLFYCPDRPVDQQYTAEPAPGCAPLLQDKTERRTRRDEERPRSKANPPVDLSSLQNAVSTFLQRYNTLVGCCAYEPDRIDEVDDLADEADRLLMAVQRGLSSGVIQVRGMTLREIMDPITRASRNLNELSARLENLETLHGQLFRSDYETAGQVRRKIAEEEDAIRQRFQPISLSESGRTGTGIEDTSVPARVGVGDDTTLPTTSGRAPGSQAGETDSLGSRTGAGIGDEASSGSNIGQTPSTGFGIGSPTGPTGESSLPTRAGPNIAD